MTIIEDHAFRVTRNADLSVEEDEAGNLLAAVELELHRRRFGQAVRLEVSAGISTDLLDMLIAEVDVPERNVYLFDVPIDLGGLGHWPTWTARISPPRPGHRSRRPPWPVAPASYRARRARHPGPPSLRVLRRIGGGLRGPWQPRTPRAGHQADPLPDRRQQPGGGGAGPGLPSRQTGHRGGRAPGPIRREGQHRLGPTLEEAGVQVIYGLVSLKTHSKISLVVRRQGDRIRRYCHIGSGNYNSSTARTYEDVGLITADPAIGADVGELFNLLTGSGEGPTFRRLVVSPVSTRAHCSPPSRPRPRPARPAGSSSRPTGSPIRGSSTPSTGRRRPASSVDLIVRGRCSLRPGSRAVGTDQGPVHRGSLSGALPDLPVRGRGGRRPSMYIGSPDLMERNLDRRVEVIVPIDDPDIQRRLVAILDDALRDEANSWTLRTDGSGPGWRRTPATTARVQPAGSLPKAGPRIPPASACWLPSEPGHRAGGRRSRPSTAATLAGEAPRSRRRGGDRRSLRRGSGAVPSTRGPASVRRRPELASGDRARSAVEELASLR